MNSDCSVELQDVHNALTEASKYNLQNEVVWSALLGLKNNPNWTIAEAISYGYYEWIK